MKSKVINQVIIDLTESYNPYDTIKKYIANGWTIANEGVTTVILNLYSEVKENESI